MNTRSPLAIRQSTAAAVGFQGFLCASSLAQLAFKEEPLTFTIACLPACTVYVLICSLPSGVSIWGSLLALTDNARPKEVKEEE